MKLIKDQDKKFIFLDRDGIINIDYGYTHKIENFVFNRRIIYLFVGEYNIGIPPWLFGFIVWDVTR